MPNSTIQLADIFHFTSVEERPLLDSNKNQIVAIVCLAILIVGLLVNGRVYNILAKPRKSAAMDQLLKFNNIISLICHPLILIFYIASTMVSPVSDYIGVTGCLLTVHLLDVFTRLYNFTFPVAVALLRYLFVVEHMKIKAVGMQTMVKFIIALTLIVPIFMTVTVQFPISETTHGPFQRCIGRFETLFKPLDPDPITPGLRGGTNQCTETRLWALDADESGFQFPFRIAFWLGCLLTTHSLWVIMFGLPEIVMYSLTFAYIKRRTTQTALSGILRPEVIKKRRKQNTLNLMMTFWTWVAQFITNIFYMVVMKFFYGKNRFFQTLFATFTLCFNFNVMPFFYVALADDDFKLAIMERDFWRMLKIFIDCSEQS